MYIFLDNQASRLMTPLVYYIAITIAIRNIVHNNRKMTLWPNRAALLGCVLLKLGIVLRLRKRDVYLCLFVYFIYQDSPSTELCSDNGLGEPDLKLNIWSLTQFLWRMDYQYQRSLTSASAVSLLQLLCTEKYAVELYIFTNNPIVNNWWTGCGRQLDLCIHLLLLVLLML